MAEISKITLPNGSEYNLKDSGAIRKNTVGNTQELRRPSHLNGLNDNTLDGKINTLRANRLAFLPADQIIIEKTTDGGTTWVDAGISNELKLGLFSETRPQISLPLLNGIRSLMCGLRITITAMKYNVPSGTAETQKYNYWNSNYSKQTERYNQLKEMYFWINAVSDRIGVKVERATGAKPNEWSVIFQKNSWGMTGWAGCDYVRFDQGVFGGGTKQTTNWWNYRLTFMTLGVNGTSTMATTYTTTPQSIMEIRGYGDTWWIKGNEYAANDKIYTHDSGQNVTFPGMVTATQFNGNATTSTTASNARNLLAYSGDEATLGANSAAAGGSTNDRIWFNFRDVMGGSTTNESTKLINYYFGNRKGSVADVTVHAATFDGNLTGSAAKVNGHTVNKDVPSDAQFTDTTYESKTAAQNGTDVSLVTTGQKYIWNSKTSNTGTVTQVTAGTGLSIGTTAGGNFTTSGTINHTNSVTAQNTQALYPIKIDAQGHISAYGSAVTPLTASSTLDATKLSGTVPTACLPSYVDDVLQYTAKANFPAIGQEGKIYVDKTTNLTWRWGGSSYVEISPSLALGTTSSTAYRGDYGNTAYTHATDSNRLTTATSSGLYKIAATAQGHIASLTAVQKSDITGLGIPGTDNDTKNTAGSTDTSSKIFLIGATSQAANSQTYSHDTAYVGTDGKLYSNSKVVLTGGSNASSSVTITPSTTNVYSMTSAGSVTAGVKNVPTKIDTTKFSGGSFTRGTFSQGTLPTLTFTMDSTDTKKLKITFGQGTLPTHAADSFTAAALQSGFYTAGTANTPTAVTLPGRSSAIKAWTGYTAATAAAQTFTGSSN